MAEIVHRLYGLGLDCCRLSLRANNYDSFTILSPLTDSGEFPHGRLKP